MSAIWPIALVIGSNIVYQICAKSTPEAMHPMASLTVTYLVGAVCALLLYFVMERGGHILREYTKLNWAPFVLGLVIVGLEVGYIYAYKLGWEVSRASIVQSAFLAVALLFVGRLLYGEPLTARKLFGVGICLAGLWVING